MMPPPPPTPHTPSHPRSPSHSHVPSTPYVPSQFFIAILVSAWDAAAEQEKELEDGQSGRLGEAIAVATTGSTGCASEGLGAAPRTPEERPSISDDRRKRWLFSQPPPNMPFSLRLTIQELEEQERLPPGFTRNHACKDTLVRLVLGRCVFLLFGYSVEANGWGTRIKHALAHSVRTRQWRSMARVQPWWRHGWPPAARQAASERPGAALRTREEASSTSDPSELPWHWSQAAPKTPFSLSLLSVQVAPRAAQARGQ